MRCPSVDDGMGRSWGRPEEASVAGADPLPPSGWAGEVAWDGAHWACLPGEVGEAALPCYCSPCNRARKLQYKCYKHKAGKIHQTNEESQRFFDFAAWITFRKKLGMGVT